jgi:hypothetical protein
MNPKYPNDYYDDEDDYISKRRSVLFKEMVSHIIMGFGLGVMATVALAGIVAWVLGV